MPGIAGVTPGNQIAPPAHTEPASSSWAGAAIGAGLALALIAATTAYVSGWLRLRRGPAVAHAGHAAAYGVGVTCLVAALFGPLDAWADVSLAGHMVQHHLLVMAPAFLFLGRPFPVAVWGLPGPIRDWVGGAMARTGPVRRGLSLVGPGASWAFLMLLIVAWHDPRAYDASVRDPLVHSLQHLTFFAGAMAFWWHALRAAPRIHRPLGKGTRAVYIMSLGPVSALVGMFLAFAPEPVYASYVEAALIRGADPLADQMLGGAIMWVSGDMALVAGLLALAADLAREERPSRTGVVPQPA